MRFFYNRGFGLNEIKFMILLVRIFIQIQSLVMTKTTVNELGDVKSLSVQGHSIGAHSKTHPKLIDLKKDELEDEIVVSSQRIENILNINIDSFAFPFGTTKVVTPEAVNLSKKKFRYVFSNVRGNVNSSPCNYFIFRQNIVPGDPMWLIQNMIEGKLDWKYKNAQNISHKLFSNL